MAYEPKTKKNETDPREFLTATTDGERRDDAFRILEMMEEISGEPAVMWGDSIIGFGTYTYRYAGGHSGEWLRVGFSPRKRNFSLYIMDGCLSYTADAASDDILSRLGKHKRGKACLYITRLADVDESVLRELIARSVKQPAIGEATST
ncbi:MAG: DUF1801 domain-containing protein [Alkalispirochaeta sp.]